MMDPYQNPKLKEIFTKTEVLRRPISGIVSDYHELPYILITPDEKNPSHSIEVAGNIKVSPRFVISPDTLGEKFGEVFDPETFDKEIEARVFSFIYAQKKNLKIESTDFSVTNYEELPGEHAERVLDKLMREENVKTGLIAGPRFKYYPISVDRFIRDILDREFNV